MKHQVFLPVWHFVSEAHVNIGKETKNYVLSDDAGLFLSTSLTHAQLACKQLDQPSQTVLPFMNVECSLGGEHSQWRGKICPRLFYKLIVFVPPSSALETFVKFEIFCHLCHCTIQASVQFSFLYYYIWIEIIFFIFGVISFECNSKIHPNGLESLINQILKTELETWFLLIYL